MCIRQMGNIWVPVFVDELPDNEGEMARMAYFSIENDELSLGWELDFETGQIPFLMLHLSGIIWRPNLQEEIFNTTEDFEKLWKAVEMREDIGFHIGINTIWIPMLKNIKNEDWEESDVFRIEYNYFYEALKFRDSPIDNKKSLKDILKTKKVIYFSDKETKVFKEWLKRQIELAQKSFPKNDNLKLKFKKGFNS